MGHLEERVGLNAISIKRDYLYVQEQAFRVWGIQRKAIVNALGAQFIKTSGGFADLFRA
jgi:hypothetical protein